MPAWRRSHSRSADAYVFVGLWLGEFISPWLRLQLRDYRPPLRGAPVPRRLFRNIEGSRA